MAQKRNACIVRLHAAAVVGHAHEGHAAVLNFHGDGRRARVDGIFDQLLNGGGRPLNDFACGDEVCDMGVELLDLRHGCVSFPVGSQGSTTIPNVIALMMAWTVMDAQMVPAFSYVQQSAADAGT